MKTALDKLRRKKAASQKTFRRKKKAERDALAQSLVQQEKTLLQKLVDHVITSLRGKRTYSRAQVEIIARVGLCPSAGGTRAALASIISIVSVVICAQPSQVPFPPTTSRDTIVYISLKFLYFKFPNLALATKRS